MQRSGNLRRDHGLALERRPWLVEQLGWTLLIVLGLGALAAPAALAGPLSRARAGAGRLEVEYSRVVRQNAPAQLALRLQPGAGADGEARLVIGADYLRAVVLASVSPAPDRVEAEPGGYVYVFRLPDPSAGATLVFDVRPQQIGQQVLRVGLDGGEPLSVGQFVLP